MKKLLSLTLMVFGLLVMTHRAEAGVAARGPKEVFVSSYTTGAILVTPAISTNATSAAAYMPGAVYQVVLSSGAASEFVVLVDSGNCTGITAPMLSSSLSTGSRFLSARLLFGSTTANTVTTFDPPVVFQNGLCMIDSAATGQAAITYELGRGLNGQ